MRTTKKKRVAAETVLKAETISLKFEKGLNAVTTCRLSIFPNLLLKGYVDQKSLQLPRDRAQRIDRNEHQILYRKNYLGM